MQEIISQDLPIARRVIGRDEAIAFFQSRGEPFKAELIAEIPEAAVSLYQQGICRPLPRAPSPFHRRIPAFKLTSLAGAYWRGDERNKMLQRIYGTAFPTQEALEKHLRLLEEAKRRDHRKLGRELDLFSISDEAGRAW